MADEIRVNRSNINRPDTSMSPDMRDSGGRSGSKLPWVILALVVVVLVVLGVLFRDKLFQGQDKNTPAGTPSGYQAVFLTNGQVYFGKLTNAMSEYVTLEDIYYLQVTQPPLQGSQTNTQATQAQPQLSLVKLGQELHGPVDSMQINHEQILFYEDMKEDGRVMQAIRQYQQNPPAPNTQSQGAPQQQQAPAVTAPANNTSR